MTKMVKYKDGDFIEYEILPLVDYYDPILRQPTIPFNFDTATSSEVDHIMYSLTETMEKEGGLGLSANQVGLNKRVCAINMGSQIWVMFNPYIVEKGEEKAIFSEGCLSYPGLFLKVDRSNHIKVKFQAAGGQEIEKEFDGLTAVVVQHEIDHLDGIAFTDKVSPIKLDQAKRKVKSTLKQMNKMQKEGIKLPNQPENQPST